MNIAAGESVCGPGRGCVPSTRRSLVCQYRGGPVGGAPGDLFLQEARPQLLPSMGKWACGRGLGGLASRFVPFSAAGSGLRSVMQHLAYLHSLSTCGTGTTRAKRQDRRLPGIFAFVPRPATFGPPGADLAMR